MVILLLQYMLLLCFNTCSAYEEQLCRKILLYFKIPPCSQFSNFCIKNTIKTGITHSVKKIHTSKMASKIIFYCTTYDWDEPYDMKQKNFNFFLFHRLKPK